MDQQSRLQQKAREQVQSFLRDCKVEDPHNKRIFEIGFKNGLFLEQCRTVGLIPTGIEIKQQYYEAVGTAYPHLDILLYEGGTIPVADESFDFVVSYQVLEHVNSTKHIFDECIRILKPGGIMYHISPNYHSFYEGHYMIIWLPFLNKTLGRLYLKMLGRHNPYYETLNLVTPKAVAAVLKNYKDITIVSLGKAEFVNNFTAEQIEKVNQKMLRKILEMLLRFGLLRKIILKFICWANLYYPITVIAVKN